MSLAYRFCSVDITAMSMPTKIAFPGVIISGPPLTPSVFNKSPHQLLLLIKITVEIWTHASIPHKVYRFV